jgi:hypothetical protein
MPTRYTQGREASLGMDIMRRINDGEVRVAPVPFIEAIKEKVVRNCEEIVEQGARIRPLMSGDKQVGWCRGVHYSERQLLKQWIKDPNDYILRVLVLGTSFSEGEVEAMDAGEIRMLTEVVQQMSSYDGSLVPYLSAFSSTATSEILWNSKGEALAAWENREVRMPDGKVIRIMRPPAHARFWVSLCTSRDAAKKRLEGNYQSLFIVRPWAGKSADSIQRELDRVARSLEVNSMEPWQQVVRPAAGSVDKTDGWGHPGDSLEDLQRELKGMMEGDKHEKVMEAWAKQMTAEDEERRKQAQEARKKRGIVDAGVYQGRVVVLTEKEIKERQAALSKGKPPQQKPRREDYEQSSASRQLEKAKKYR